jgi:hypothetical protein
MGHSKLARAAMERHRATDRCHCMERTKSFLLELKLDRWPVPSKLVPLAIQTQ